MKHSGSKQRLPYAYAAALPVALKINEREYLEYRAFVYFIASPTKFLAISHCWPVLTHSIRCDELVVALDELFHKVEMRAQSCQPLRMIHGKDTL